jgi:heat shock protein HtpX
MYGAQEIDARSAPNLFDIVQRLSATAGMPMPRIYVIDSEQPNAFATGRDPGHAAVAITSGLLRTLSNDEVAGVMAHELTHIKHRDTLIMTVTATLAGALSMLANFGMFFGGRSRDNPLGPMGAILLAILSPIIAMIVQMAISRSREYEADRGGAEISGKPLALASALQRIEAQVHGTVMPQAEAHPATAHLFIMNPLHGGGMRTLFASHPSTEERVQRLAALARQMGDRSAPPQPGPWG